MANTQKNVEEILKESIRKQDKINLYNGVLDIYTQNGSFRLDDDLLNEVGHYFIAKDLFDYLTKNNIIPSKEHDRDYKTTIGISFQV